MRKMTEASILYEKGNFWVSNEGSAINPKYHVWRVGLTHSTVDSAYTNLSLAVARCKYLAKQDTKR